MRTVTSKFATNLRSKKAFKELILLGLFEDKKNPHYRAEYVDRIRKAEKENTKGGIKYETVMADYHQEIPPEEFDETAEG